MIGRGERVIITSIAVLIVVLLTLMFYYNTVTESQGSIRNISVLIQSPSDRFRKGLEKAARENNVDLRLETTFETAQSEIMQREINNNADAIIIKATDADAMQSYLAGLEQLVNIVTVDEPLQAQGLVAHIGVEQLPMAEMLAGVVAERSPGMKCIIVFGGEEARYEREQAELLGNALVQRGMDCEMVTCAVQNISYELPGNAVLIAASTDMLLPLCERAGNAAKIYGIGYDNSLRDYLEQRRIQALVVYSEFDAGYLSLQAAAMAIGGSTVPVKQLMLFVADADTMYQPPVNQVLFPIE